MQFTAPVWLGTLHILYGCLLFVYNGALGGLNRDISTDPSKPVSDIETLGIWFLYTPFEVTAYLE